MVLKRRSVAETASAWAFPSQFYLLSFSAGFQFPPAMDTTSHILKKTVLQQTIF